MVLPSSPSGSLARLSRATAYETAFPALSMISLARAFASASSYRWQAQKCPGSTSSHSGGACLHTSWQWAQRVWNLHPAGGLAGEGMLPWRMIRCSCASGSGMGMAENSA